MNTEIKSEVEAPVGQLTQAKQNYYSRICDALQFLLQSRWFNVESQLYKTCPGEQACEQ